MNLKQLLENESKNHETARDSIKEHEVTTYRKVGGNEARQFFATTGQLSSIERNTANETVVQVIEGFDTTVGQLCSALVQTLAGGNIATNPGEQDGALNITSAQILVDNGIMSQAAKDLFFSQASDVSKPYSKLTKYEVMITRGALIPKAQVAAVERLVTIQTTEDTETYNPCIYRRVGAGMEVVGRFQGIGKKGTYSVLLGSGVQTVLIDNPYNTITAGV